MRKIFLYIKKYKLYLLLLFPLLYVIYYLNTSYPAMEEVDQYLQDSKQVQVQDGKWVTFTSSSSNGKGILFYPGGKVEPESYAPLMHELAELGYNSYLIKMPFNLAVFNANAAEKVIEANPQIKEWYIGGHSLGGAMASQFVNKHPEAIKGIFFLAAYPVDSTSLVGIPVKSLSIYAEKDGLVPLEEMKQHILLLPEDRTLKIIEGGNHGQFGSYGEQAKDQKASLSREEQRKQVIEAITLWIEK